MSELTFLSTEENRPDVLQKLGNQALLTDFSILLGAGTCFSGFEGSYYTRTNKKGYDNLVYIIREDGFTKNIETISRLVGGRPVLIISPKDKIIMELIKNRMPENEILEIEYGHYPQKAVSRRKQDILEELYKKRRT